MKPDMVLGSMEAREGVSQQQCHMTGFLEPPRNCDHHTQQSLQQTHPLSLHFLDKETDS